MRKIFTLIGIIVFIFVQTPSQAQTAESHNFITYDTAITIPLCPLCTPDQWNVRITRPTNMFVGGNADTASRPAIITMPGVGEQGTNDPSKLTVYGPHYWLQNGWDGSVVLGNGTHYPILITVSYVNTENPTAPSYYLLLTYILNTYHIKRSSVFLGGLSQGSFSAGALIEYETTPGAETGMSMIKAMALFEGTPDPLPAPYSTWSRGFTAYQVWAQKYGGRYFYLEGNGADNFRDGWQYANAMNAAVPNSAYFSYEDLGGGAHCCWNSMYDPSATNWTCVGTLGPNNAPSQVGTNTMGNYHAPSSVFQWMLRQGDTSMVGSGAAPPPPPPVANAGSNQTITLPTNSVTLSGSASLGSIASFGWSLASGPNTPSIASPNAATTVVSGLIAGTYTFSLKVTALLLQVSIAQVTVVVQPAPKPNQPPVANAGSAQTITLPANSASLSGSGTDPDGSIASYNWIQAGGPSQSTITNAGTANPTVSNLVAGVYDFRLTVTDNSGATATSDVNVTVNAAAKVAPPPSQPNQPPVANAGGAQTITLPTSSTTLSGSGSEIGGTIVSYNWFQAGGPTLSSIANANTANPTVGKLYAGVYIFRLTVTDNSGATATKDVNVTVNPAPAGTPAPVVLAANPGNAQTLTLAAGNTTTGTTLSGSGTSPNGPIVSYSWFQAGGPTLSAIASANTANPTVSNLYAGVYIFRLTVTDNTGATVTGDVDVTVNVARTVQANQPLVANAGNAQTITLPTSSTTLSGSGTSATGTIVSYNWFQAGGPTLSSIANANTANPTVSKLYAGVYIFRLTVTDNTGATATNDMNVTVNPAPAGTPPPVVLAANPGTAQTITLPTNSTILSGSGTSPNGPILSYSWFQAGGPTLSSIANANTANPTVSNLYAGVYIFRLTVTDNTGATATNDVDVTVNPVIVGTPPVTTPPPPVTVPSSPSNLTIPGQIEAENFTNNNGGETQATTDAGGGLNVGWIYPGEWLSYNVNVTAAGTYTASFRVATPNANAAFQLRASDGTVLANFNLAPTGDWQTWQTITASVTLPAGAQTLILISSGTDLWNINWMRFDPVTQTPPSVPAGNGKSIPGKIEAENFDGNIGGETQATTDVGGGLNVGWIYSGEWLSYNVTVAAAGTYTANFRVATPNANASFQLRTATGAVLASFNLASTGGWQTWQTVSASVTLPAGPQTLIIISTGTDLWNINWVEYDGTGQTAGTTGNKSLPGKIEAESYDNMNGVQTQNTADIGGGLNVGWIDQGDWMSYNVNVATAGTYLASFRIATPNNGCSLQLQAADGTVLANLNFNSTSDYQVYQTFNAVVNLPAGAQTLRVVNTGTVDWNFNWMAFDLPGKNIPGQIEAENYDAMSGVMTQSTADIGGGLNVGWIDQGDWMSYNVNVANAGTYLANLRIATPNTGCTMQLQASNGTVLATFSVTPTGDFQIYQTVSAAITLPAGNQTLWLVSTGLPSWNINWLDFTDLTGSTSLTGGPITTATTGTASAFTAVSANGSADSTNAALALYPNPAHDQTTLEINNIYTGKMLVQVLDGAGAVLRRYEVTKDLPIMRLTVATGDLATGTYFVHVLIGNYTATRKLLKR